MGRTALLKTMAVEQVMDSVQAESPGAIRPIILLAIELLESIDPGADYPSEFVVWRLTGAREAVAEESIPGLLLRRELGVLIQRASARVPLPAETVEGGARELHAVASGIGVSVRTLQRWRDQGLVIEHFRFPDGQVRLGVSGGSLSRFRESDPQRFARAAGFTRMDASEERRLTEAADALVADGASPNQAALHVAASSPRAHETIRQLMRRRRGQTGPITGAGGRVTDHERQLVLNAWQRGVAIERVASRLGRSLGAVRRIGAEVRADRLRAISPQWIRFPVFADPEAERILLEAPRIREQPGPVDASSISGLLAAGGEDADILESMLIPAMHLQRCLAAGRIASLGRSPADARLDEIETELRRADRLRMRAGRAVIGTALARLQQAEGVAATEAAEPELAARLAFCVEVVDQVLDRFDPRARGDLEPRLERRVALETDKQIALHERTGARSPGSRPGPGRTTDLLVRLEPLRRWLGLPPFLAARLDRLPRSQRGLLEDRFGLGRSRPQSLSGLASRLGTTSRDVQQRLRASMSSLRAAKVD
ncbi:MAG: hypothetical protein VX684_00895 [Planctomycetota bacterium]|nr:hypothetical protein [Planctomycetota bacterium]